MKHLKAVNGKAERVERATQSDVVALQRTPQQPTGGAGPHFPIGCSLVFSPGWEADRAGGRLRLLGMNKRGARQRQHGGKKREPLHGRHGKMRSILRQSFWAAAHFAVQSGA